MKTIVAFLNFFKTRFRWLLIASAIILGAVVVQYIGSYSSFVYKYSIALGLAVVFILTWYGLEKKISQHWTDANERSVIWIAVFLSIIVFGWLHVVQKEWNYQYSFPMCDCNETAKRSDRIGAICKDGFKSYATGRGTCSEHNGVQRWQCECD